MIRDSAVLSLVYFPTLGLNSAGIIVNLTEYYFWNLSVNEHSQSRFTPYLSAYQALMGTLSMCTSAEFEPWDFWMVKAEDNHIA